MVLMMGYLQILDRFASELEAFRPQLIHLQRTLLVNAAYIKTPSNPLRN
jgi:hypothetical protein